MRGHPARRRPDSGGGYTVFGTRSAVACEHPQATLAGIRALDDGGNAADACVVMAASMAVLAPGKRSLNTIIPGLATKDSALWATYGVMGGSTQPQGHAHLLSNLVDHDMSLQEAVDHPRHRHEGDTLLVEGRVPKTEVEKLREMGCDVEVGADYAVPTGGAQLIRVLESSVRSCGSDPRKDGCALVQ